MDVRPSDTLSPSGLMSRIANRTGRDRLFGVNIRRNENARFGLDNETANSFQRYGIILLIFYVVMTLIGTLNDARAHRKVELSNVNDTISELARQVDSNLSQAVAWTETAISSAGTPARMVSVAARGQNVAGAAVILQEPDVGRTCPRHEPVSLAALLRPPPGTAHRCRSQLSGAGVWSNRHRVVERVATKPPPPRFHFYVHRRRNTDHAIFQPAFSGGTGR